MFPKYLILVFLLIISKSELYDHQLARDLGNYARLAYNQQRVKDWNCIYCLENPISNTMMISNQEKDVFAFMAYFDALDIIVIAFRGTKMTIDNIKNNLAHTQTKFEGIQKTKVHRTFYQAFLSIKDALLEKVDKMVDIYPSSDVYLTGHSHGGALAVLAATELNKLYHIAAVYTFGAPRVGNKAFARHVEEDIRVYRIVNSKDFVPYFPFRQSPVKAIFQKTQQELKQQKAKKCKDEHKPCMIQKQHKYKIQPWQAFKLGFSTEQLVDNVRLVNATYSHAGTQIFYDMTRKRINQCSSKSSKCYNAIPFNSFDLEEHDMSFYLRLMHQAEKEEWEQQL